MYIDIIRLAVKHIKACNDDAAVPSELVPSFCSTDALSSNINSETIDMPIASVNIFRQRCTRFIFNS